MPSTPRSTRATQVIVWGVAITLVILAVFAIRSLTNENVAVVVAKVTYRDLQKSYSTTGKVEPTDDFEVHAQSPGQVQSIYVNLGEKVKAGQLLLKLNDTGAIANLAHAQSQLKAATLAANDIHQGGTREERSTNTAEIDKAKLQRQQDDADLTARQKLLQQGAASPAEVAEAQHKLQLDDANILSLQQHITQRYGKGDAARAAADVADAQSAVTAAENTYATDNIRSKIAGTVYYLPVAEYDYVATGDDLIYVANLSDMRVTAYFDEPDIGNLAVGQPVTITWEAKPHLTWHGHVSMAPTTVINYQQRFVGECLITIDDASGDLAPNANVVVTVTTAMHPHVLSVPHEAVHQGPSGYYVFRVVNNKLVRTPVLTGIMNLKQDEIVSGLSEGDTIALNATVNRELMDGLDVSPVQ